MKKEFLPMEFLFKDFLLRNCGELLTNSRWSDFLIEPNALCNIEPNKNEMAANDLSLLEINKRGLNTGLSYVDVQMSPDEIVSYFEKEIADFMETDNSEMKKKNIRKKLIN